MPVLAPDSKLGLSGAEAARRAAERGHVSPPASSRSYASIVRANLLTVFNLILLVAGAATLLFGDWRDALFLAILVANAAIGIAQEVRAKRALDRLAALVAPEATVVRDGAPARVPVPDVVTGDLVELAPGDQVVADGPLVRAEGLLLDESILTGESHPVPRETGDDVRSGSFVAEGAGAFVVSAVGPESYAERVAGEARTFRHPRSPLQDALDRLLWALVALMVPLAVVLGVSLSLRDRSAEDNVQTAVAAIVSLIPEGLILLASLTYAVAALRMARRGALAQELNAVESLASVDVLCTDKTGTLTSADLQVVGLVPAPDVAEEELGAALGRYAAAAPGPTGRWPRSPPPSRRGPRRRGPRCRSRRAGAGLRWSSTTARGCSARRSPCRLTRSCAGARTPRLRAGGAWSPSGAPPARCPTGTATRRPRSPCWGWRCSPSGCARTRGRRSPTCARRASRSRSSRATRRPPSQPSPPTPGCRRAPRSTAGSCPPIRPSWPRRCRPRRWSGGSPRRTSGAWCRR